MPAPEGWWSFRVLDESSSVNDLSENSPWQAVYPNPARTITCLEIDMPQSAECRVTLANSFGQQVAILHDGSLSRGLQRIFLNASNLAAGPYLVTLTTAQGVYWTQRVMVEK